MIRGIVNQSKKIHYRNLLTKNQYKFYGFNNEIPKYDPSKDYYRVLAVNKNSSETQIKKAFYQLARQYHPDSHPGFEAKFKEVN